MIILIGLLLIAVAYLIFGAAPGMTVLLGWTGDNTAPANNFDLSALTPESDFSIVNSH